ncbi:hypothetical protein GCM10023334_019810 [Nonomuraea thailandensis]
MSGRYPGVTARVEALRASNRRTVAIGILTIADSRFAAPRKPRFRQAARRPDSSARTLAAAVRPARLAPIVLAVGP